MTGCERFDAELGAYHDEALEVAERTPVELHLQDCERCQGTLARIASLDAALRALPRSEPSPDFAAQFRARIGQAEATGAGQADRAQEAPAARGRAPRRRGWRSLGWVGAAGTAAAAAAAALLLAVPPEETLTGEDWEIVADQEAFELLVDEDEDLDLLYALDALENWDEGQES
jgi:anti-sigma factor RsiW